MNNLLEKLNNNQKEAVLHTEGPLLILAGAGSGKTRVITNRIAYLIQQKNVPPYNIVAVTFTNKAAGEMKKRVIDLTGSQGNSVFIKTFHSASVYILRRFGERAGIPRFFSIYDSSDQETLIKEILLEMKLDPKKIKPRMIASHISSIKEKAEFFSAGPDALMPEHLPFNFPEVYKTYHQRLKKVCALDFNDLLIETARLLRSCPEELAAMQRMWKYFMIDEYQDTNHAQYLISKYLSSATRNLCVVGDDDQSIYSWRGADIKNILDFEKDYSEAKVITLEENYRSVAQILDSASCVIKNNVHRKKKNLIPVRGDGELITWCRTNNERGEAGYVISKILSLKNREGMKNNDFAVFYRTNAQSRVFEEYLRKENLPYRIIGGLKFYDRKEIKDILAYLKIIANPADAVSLFRVINVPARGLGSASIASIREAAAEKDITEWEVILNSSELKIRASKGLNEFKDVILRGMEIAAETPGKYSLSDLVNEIIEISGYKKSMESDDSTEAKARLENIDEFINSIYDYEQMNMESGLDEFLQSVSLLTSEENPDDVTDETGFITLMTVHIAKGLEFPVVFLTGMEDGTFPHINSIDTEQGLEEERRLCYVGITRAMDKLYITNAEIRRSWGEVRYRIPSRFINEIPAEYIESDEYIDEYSSGSYPSDSFPSENYSASFSSSSFKGRGSVRSFSYSNPKPKAQYEFSTSSFSSNGFTEGMSDHSESKFKLRDVVVHPKYGRGTITGIKGSGDNIKITISFTGGRSKVFLEKYTQLDRLM
ncbi:MAG: UvrD-helicase domain-containing protein [Spirochaetes bacterium]|nr:UvrD-helicase domain-containing protein [Spirochaetota bacterium]